MGGRRLFAAAVGAVGVLFVGACGSSAEKSTLVATMVGAAEAPGPGALKGQGQARVEVNQTQSEVCYELEVSEVPGITMAHIHEGAVDVAGPVVVPLDPPSGGIVENCVDVDQGLADNLAANPNGFYVNIHTGEFPDGAIRGQLHVKGTPVPEAQNQGGGAP